MIKLRKIETKEDIWEDLKKDRKRFGRTFQAHLGIILTDYLNKVKAKEAKEKR